MRAVVCDRLGDATEAGVLRLDDCFPAPQLKKGHVLIRVVAASINYPDYLQIKGEYQVKPELPFIPGSEVAGIVTELGPGVTKLSVGDKVWAAAGSMRHVQPACAGSAASLLPRPLAGPGAGTRAPALLMLMLMLMMMRPGVRSAVWRRVRRAAGGAPELGLEGARWARLPARPPPRLPACLPWPARRGAPTPGVPVLHLLHPVACCTPRPPATAYQLLRVPRGRAAAAVAAAAAPAAALAGHRPRSRC
jgi:hypothetical protein